MVQTLRHSLTDHGFTVQKRLKGIEALSIIILLIEIKRYRSATRIDDSPTSFVFKHNNLIKIIDDPQNYTRTFYRFAEAVDQGIKKLNKCNIVFSF